ncbi:hypothetical protein [Allobaculum sp. JKK-2023]|uniref:hypothetical protein n=1 Tax=Allobaculum sp. JKK-2023 TaxID=3108943 RepID=UPI002B05AD9C|nr:hypothetical protein [Allobaculum sp. JKK-2023]
MRNLKTLSLQKFSENVFDCFQILIPLFAFMLFTHSEQIRIQAPVRLTEQIVIKNEEKELILFV